MREGARDQFDLFYSVSTAIPAHLPTHNGPSPPQDPSQTVPMAAVYLFPTLQLDYR